jgi:predicted NAD/FAD-dependent oxidoreductase
MTEHSAAHVPGKLHFAIVGAGVAGLTCARALTARGIRTTVYERGRAVGGRVLSQQTESGSFDVGAQYLTVQCESFADQVRRWASADLVSSWETNLAELSGGQAALVQTNARRYVGIPSMQSIAIDLARGLDIVFDAPVARIARGSAEWYLFDPHERPLGIAGFDGLVMAVPSIDALPLVRSQTDFAPRLEAVRWDACWTSSLALSRPSTIEFDAAFINDDPILAWAARESSKPLRRNGEGVAERWLLQARPGWSNSFLELPSDDAARWMQRAFAARVARPLAQKTCTAMLWRTGTPAEVLPETFLWDAQRVIGLAGDWCGGARVEAAYVSGLALAQAIVG